MRASKQRRRKNQCDGKNRHHTAESAIKTLHKWTEKKKKGISIYDFVIYACEFCDSWHIGSNRDSYVYQDYTELRPKIIQGIQLPLWRISRKGKNVLPWNDPLFSKKEGYSDD